MDRGAIRGSISYGLDEFFFTIRGAREIEKRENEHVWNPSSKGYPRELSGVQVRRCCATALVLLTKEPGPRSGEP